MLEDMNLYTEIYNGDKLRILASSAYIRQSARRLFKFVRERHAAGDTWTAFMTRLRSFLSDKRTIDGSHLKQEYLDYKPIKGQLVVHAFEDFVKLREDAMAKGFFVADRMAMGDFLKSLQLDPVTMDNVTIHMRQVHGWAAMTDQLYECFSGKYVGGCVMKLLVTAVRGSPML
eukprot:jgi/Mesvir1/28284/Mv04807-RA.1